MAYEFISVVDGVGPGLQGTIPGSTTELLKDYVGTYAEFRELFPEIPGTHPDLSTTPSLAFNLIPLNAAFLVGLLYRHPGRNGATTVANDAPAWRTLANVA